MGSLRFWVLAMATLLGASASWSAEGHRSSRRSGVDVAGAPRTPSLESRPQVSVGKKATQIKHQQNT